MNSAVGFGVNAFNFRKDGDYVFPDADVILPAMVIFACKNRKVISLPSAGHFRHLADGVKLRVYRPDVNRNLPAFRFNFIF